MVVAAIWFGCNNAARDVVGEWTIFQRERMVNLKLPSYVFSKFAVMVGPVRAAVPRAALDSFTSRPGLQGSFVRGAATLILSSLVGAALGLAISARSRTTESAIALLPVVLLPVIALGGGIRAVYKMPEPARSSSYIVPSRWALESNFIAEAKARPCGYLPAERGLGCVSGWRPRHRRRDRAVPRGRHGGWRDSAGRLREEMHRAGVSRSARRWVRSEACW